MKRFFLFAVLLGIGLGVRAGDIVVRPGDSVSDALRQAREWRRTGDPRCEGGIRILLQAGRYHLDEPLMIRPEDSGTEDSPTLIRGEAGAVLCGDPRQAHTQLWPREGMERLIAFDAQARTITIPTPPRRVRRAKNLEMVVHQRWAIAILRVKDMRVQGDRTVVSFHEPESSLEFEHPWPQPVIGGERGNSSFLLRTTEQRLGLEQLVVIAGTDEDPVCHVSFEGVGFEHSCWNRPLRQGHVTLQGGFPLLSAYKLRQEGLPWDAGLENQAWIERPVAAVSVRGARQVHFRGCSFRHLGATALDFADGIYDCSVSGSRFEDIGGTAILAGSFAEFPREVHRPYPDLAERCRALEITGNVIRESAVEDWGAVAIGCGYVRETTIADNDVRGTAYSGICLGWGWTAADTGTQDNHIMRNKVYDYARQLYDAGGIYTLSLQRNSSVCDNEIGAPGPAPYATNDRGFRIYLDARSDGFLIRGNRTGGRPIRRDEIGDNQPGPGLQFVEE